MNKSVLISGYGSIGRRHVKILSRLVKKKNITILTNQKVSNFRTIKTLQALNKVDPDYIVCWGSVAAKNLLDTKEPIGRMRGEFRSYGRAKVLCTYHPSYLLRNPPAKKDVWDDMKFLFQDMGITLDS